LVKYSIIAAKVSFFRHMPRGRSQEALHKGSYTQAAIEWTWPSGESLLLVALQEMAFLPLRVRIFHEKPLPVWWPACVAFDRSGCRSRA